MHRETIARQSFPRWRLEWAQDVPRPARSAKIIPFPGPRGAAMVTYERPVVFPRRGPEASRTAEVWPRNPLARGLALAAIGLFGVALAFVG